MAEGTLDNGLRSFAVLTSPVLLPERPFAACSGLQTSDSVRFILPPTGWFPRTCTRVGAITEASSVSEVFSTTSMATSRGSRRRAVILENSSME